jgi:hypothetical protein
MAWRDGEWTDVGVCEDAPCCGCCGPGSDDPSWRGGEDPPDVDEWYDSDGFGEMLDGAHDELPAPGNPVSGRFY